VLLDLKRRARRVLRQLRNERWFAAGSTFAESLPADERIAKCTDRTDNPLRTFFDRRVQGAGIWKWTHYFDIYHRHLESFRGSAVNVVEVGVYSGGSLDMWRDYFGIAATIHGVDIAPECRAYEREQIKISIGDQADPRFWQDFKAKTPSVDVLIDDGGHTPRQQLVTLREMLPHLAPGGVYICEDIHGLHNAFATFVYGLVDHLNSSRTHRDRPGSVPACGAQTVVESVCFYPFVTVITKTRAPVTEFLAPKHGTEWQPFLL